MQAWKWMCLLGLDCCFDSVDVNEVRRLASAVGLPLPTVTCFEVIKLRLTVMQSVHKAPADIVMHIWSKHTLLSAAAAGIASLKLNNVEHATPFPCR